MVKHGSGVMLNIASDVGNISPDHRIYEGAVNPHTGTSFNTPIAYATTKAALINFTRYLATYWADKGIRVNCLSPGGVSNDHDPRFVHQVVSRIPLGRMARADELSQRGALSRFRRVVLHDGSESHRGWWQNELVRASRHVRFSSRMLEAAAILLTQNPASSASACYI